MKPLDLSVKNLINIGVFSAIYFVIFFTGGMLGIFGPQFIFIGGIIAGILQGIVMMLYLVKTKTIGALTITGILCGTLMTLTGHAIYTLILGTIFGFLGDLICASGNFSSRWKNIIGYAVFSLWGIAPFLPIFINRAAYLEHVTQQMKSAEYAQQVDQLFTLPLVCVYIMIALLISIGSGYFGTKLLDKHFKRAGLV